MALPFSTTALAAINDAAGHVLGHRFRIKSCRPVAGCPAHRSFVVGDEDHRFFLKVDGVEALPVFEAEAEGLHALREANARAPIPLAHAVAGNEAFLIMEYLTLREPRDGDYVGLAHMLGTLHESTHPAFGWPQPNFLGPSRQANPWMDSWPDFWRSARLERQLELAQQNGWAGELQSMGERLLAGLPQIFADYAPEPSLVHGDLRRGNVGFLMNGVPVLFDPAVYFGDREVDIAMTELSGGFPRIFYDAYYERFPMREGYPLRRDVYNLYWLLSQLNVAGAPYQERVENAMRSLLAQAG